MKAQGLEIGLRYVGAAVLAAVEARIDQNVTADELVDDALSEVEHIHGVAASELRALGFDEMAHSLRRAMLLEQEQAANAVGFSQAA